MRLLPFVLALAGCAGSHFKAPELPELVSTAAKPAPALPLLLAPGERMIWDVTAHSMSIGRVELVVGALDVRSSFSTTGLATMFATAHHELATQLDRAAGAPTAMSETLVFDGETDHTEAQLGVGAYQIGAARHEVPQGAPAHTMHSALGWVRSWAKPGAPNSFLFVLHLDRLYRLDVATPIAEDLNGVKTLRVDCEVRAPDRSDPVPFSVWLTADAQRLPLKLVFDTKSGHITAEMI
jgi:hypothetical protein